MSSASLLAAAAALLSVAAAYEWLAARPRRAPQAGAPPTLRGRSLVAALRLGVPGRIARAGLSGRLGVRDVLIAKPGCAVAAGVVAWAAAPAAPGRLSVAVAIALPAAGFLVPDALLERIARRRRRSLVGALPDALDLLAVSAASGRSVFAAFAELARSGQDPLAAELGAVAAEVAAGRAPDRALHNLRQRVPGNELAAMCAAIERSRRFGSPLAEQLHRQAGSLRCDLRRETEERAGRAAPKIQLVVALVLVPSVLLMIVAGLVANADRLLAGF